MEWSFVILLVGYRSNDNRFRVYENVEEIYILILSIFFRKYYLQYTNFLRMNDKESVNVSSAIPVYALEKQEQIKTVSISSLPFSLVSWFSLNWLNGLGIEIAFGGKFKDDST